MNILLVFGLLVLAGYLIGLLFQKVHIPKILGYVAVGVIFSPGLSGFTDEGFMESVTPVMNISLAFIVFEVGGEIKWIKIRQHKKEILSITLLSGIVPFFLLSAGMYIFFILFPGLISLKPFELLMFAILAGALAGPTAPATAFAVIHQYRARGRVTDTILEVVALLDVLGILLFSITLAAIPLLAPYPESTSGAGNITEPMSKIGVSVIIGLAAGYMVTIADRILKITREDQWIIILFSLIILGLGISSLLATEELLVFLTMGVTVANTCRQQNNIFGMLHRYTESLVFLIFFLLSGLHLNVNIIFQALPAVVLFVFLRILGRYFGVAAGARLTHADMRIRKYTVGGLLPQAGITIGLVLDLYQKEVMGEITDLLLATIMGATIINELIGPFTTRYSLKKSGEINASPNIPVPESKAGQRRAVSRN